MKKNELTKAEAMVNAEVEQQIRAGRYARRGISPKKFSGAMPAPMEVAILAATLARASAENTEKLCGAALNLWFTSQETIALQQQCNEDYQQRKAAEKPFPKPPKNQEWPMTLETFCKILWPKKNTGERAAIIRAWLKILPDGVSYSAMNGEPIDKQRFYFLSSSILPWFEEWKIAQISAQRSAAANKRHRKARPPREKLIKIVQELKEGD
jgi:hypothetical protein